MTGIASNELMPFGGPQQPCRESQLQRIRIRAPFAANVFAAADEVILWCTLYLGWLSAAQY